MNSRRPLRISPLVLAFLVFGGKAALASGSNVATLPQRWVNQHECDGMATVVKKVCHQGDSQCPFVPGDYDATAAGLNQAISDAENLRVSSGTGTAIRITAGADIKISGSAQSIVLRNFGYTGSRCIIFESSNPLPSRVRVGSVAISSIARGSVSNTVKVMTSSPHLLNTGDAVEIKNVTGGRVNFNGDYPASVVDARAFTYSQQGPAEMGVVTPTLTVVTGPNTLAQQKSRNMYTLETTAINVPVIYADPGAHHYVFYDGEIETTETTLGQAGPIVVFGPRVPATTFAGNARHIGFDRMYVHGCAGTVPTSIPTWPQPVPCGSLDAGLKSGVRLNCSFCWVVNSFFDQMQMPGIESHALGTYNGQGPFKIVNNHLRGGATTFHLGDTPPTIPGLVPSNIEVRLNTIDLDPNWFFVSHAFCGGTTGVKWGLKSRLDFENAQRMVFEGNELYQSWCDGDTGEMIYMGPAACSSTNCGGGNQARMSDIYFANNLIAHSHRVFIIAGRGGSTGTSLPFQRMDVVNNLAWDIGIPFDTDRVLETAIGSRGQTYTCAARRVAGVATLSDCICLQRNCPITGVSSGDWLLTSNCSDPSFNTTRTPALFSQPKTSGPITYANPGPDVTAGVTCTLSNRQGFPRFLSFRHNTMVANLNSAGALFVNNPDGPVSYYVRDFTLIDSISSNTPGTPGTGWKCNALPDGSRSSLSGRCWDVSSLTFHHFVAEGRGPSSNYSEYRNGVEVFPSTTVSFPTTNRCSGVYSGCLGYAGDFRTSNPADYHDFALCHGPGIPSANCTGRSVYAGAASDGTDIGVDLNQLDQARVRLRFSASSYPQ